MARSMRRLVHSRKDGLTGHLIARVSAVHLDSEDRRVARRLDLDALQEAHLVLVVHLEVRQVLDVHLEVHPVAHHPALPRADHPLVADRSWQNSYWEYLETSEKYKETLQ